MSGRGAEPAYPRLNGLEPMDRGHMGIVSSTGLTKREAAAIAAMQGLLAAGAGTGGHVRTVQGAAQVAVQHADALLAELDKSA